MSIYRCRTTRFADKKAISRLLLDKEESMAGMARALGYTPHYLRKAISGLQGLGEGSELPGKVAEYLGENVDTLFPPRDPRVTDAGSPEISS